MGRTLKMRCPSCGRYEPLQVSKCEKCGRVIAEPKELIKIQKR